MRRRRSLLPALVGVLLVWSGSLARAETPEARMEALAEMREGNRLLDAGNAAGALGHFERARTLVKSPKLHFNFGQALAGIAHREAEAHEEFTRYLEEVPDASPETRAEASRQVLGLRGKIGLVTIATEPDAAEISVDGQARGVTALARPLPVPPGSHDLRLVKSGFAPISEVISVAAGGEWSKAYRLQPSVAVAPTVLEPSQLPPTSMTAQVTIAARPVAEERGGVDQRHKLRFAAVVGAGGGLALGVAGIFAYRTGASKLDHIMQASVVGDRYSESDGNYKVWGDTGLGLVIAGGVVLASAAVLYWLNRPDHLR